MESSSVESSPKVNHMLKKHAWMIAQGIAIAVILCCLFPNQLEQKAPDRDTNDKSAVIPVRLETRSRFNGRWENSDGDKLDLTETNTGIQVRLVSSYRIADGEGVLKVNGRDVQGTLTARFKGDASESESDFRGTISEAGIIEYSVLQRGSLQRHTASMWRTAFTQPGGILCEVESVQDGDTLTVETNGGRRIKVRLAGIDAPETSTTPIQPFGLDATTALEEKVAGKIVSIVPKEADRWGRTVADVWVNDRWVNLELIQEGSAWWYEEYAPDNKEMQRAQMSAESQRLGLWRESRPVPPREWREKYGRE